MGSGASSTSKTIEAGTRLPKKIQAKVDKLFNWMLNAKELKKYFKHVNKIHDRAECLKRLNDLFWVFEDGPTARATKVTATQFSNKLTQLWYFNQDATENMVDKHIWNFAQYLASKEEGHKTKQRDSDTAGATATELKENEGNSKEEDDNLQNSLSSSTTHNAGVLFVVSPLHLQKNDDGRDVPASRLVSERAIRSSPPSASFSTQTRLPQKIVRRPQTVSPKKERRFKGSAPVALEPQPDFSRHTRFKSKDPRNYIFSSQPQSAGYNEPRCKPPKTKNGKVKSSPGSSGFGHCNAKPNRASWLNRRVDHVVPPAGRLVHTKRKKVEVNAKHHDMGRIPGKFWKGSMLRNNSPSQRHVIHQRSVRDEVRKFLSPPPGTRLIYIM